MDAPVASLTFLTGLVKPYLKPKLIEESITELSYFLKSVKSNQKFLESPGWDIFIDLADLDGYHYHTGIMFSLYTSAWHEAIVRGGRYEKVKTITGDSRPAVGLVLTSRN